MTLVKAMSEDQKAVRHLRIRLAKEKRAWHCISSVSSTEILYSEPESHLYGIGVVFEGGVYRMFEVRVYANSYKVWET